MFSPTRLLIWTLARLRLAERSTRPPQGYDAPASVHKMNQCWYSHNSAVIRALLLQELCRFGFIWWSRLFCTGSMQTLKKGVKKNCVSSPPTTTTTTRSSLCSSCSSQPLISFPSYECVLPLMRTLEVCSISDAWSQRLSLFHTCRHLVLVPAED